MVALTMKIMSLCAMLSVVNSVAVKRQTTEQVFDNYDDLEAGTQLAEYRDLFYTGFIVGAPATGSIILVPASTPNGLFADQLRTQEQARITAQFPGTTTRSFNATAIAQGCYTALRQGALGPPLSCTIRYTGRKYGTGELVTHEAAFNLRGNNLAGVGLEAEDMQVTNFPPTFTDLVNMEFAIVTAALPLANGGLAQFGVDNFNHALNYLP